MNQKINKSKKTIRFFLLVYIIYIPIFLLILYFSARAYKGFSIFHFFISDLGEKTAPFHNLFQISVIIFGFLSFFFVQELSDFLPDSKFLKTSIFFLFLTYFLIILAAIFSSDEIPVMHQLLGEVFFVSIFVACFCLIYPMFKSKQISNFLIVLNFVFLFFWILGTISYVGLKSNYGSFWTTEMNLAEFARTQKSFILRNITLWEWMIFSLAILLNFLISIIILKNQKRVAEKRSPPDIFNSIIE